ncbi:MAG TPA: ABC transporter permease [Burkholderiales bacterium]|jgi:peptide/nickel transport system permease protein|nr:ABC transporter permease [Burkholderiales bacterium]
MSAAAEALPHARAETPFRRLAREFFSNRVATAAFAVLLTLILLALFAPLIAPQNPYDLAKVTVLDARLAPGERGSAGFVMWLGADGAGRDMWSAMLYGLRISLGVGVASGAIALAIGTAIGLLAAYRGGWLDALIMRLVDLQLSFPAILVALILVAILGRGADKVMIALILVQWAYYARTVRGSALVERRKEYIEAAHCLALPARRIVFRHLLPNVVAPMIVVGTLQTAHAISLEATLSFLGVGLPLTEPSLGLLIANGFEYMLSGKYWISFYPGLALLATIMSINLVGDRLRDILNPRLER